MDTVAKHVGDDPDLDALMVRVREAAMAGGPSDSAARTGTAGDAPGADADLLRVLDAQAEWNERTRQSLAALVDCLRTLRDDWADAHARLREDVGKLSVLVDELRTRRPAAVTRSNQLNKKSKRPRGSASTPAKRRTSNGRRPRS